MARKRLNKSLVVVLTLVMFVVMIVVSAVMLRRLRQRDPAYFVNLAVRYEEEGEWQQAALFYKEAWERSHDATHLVSHGQMLLSDGEVGRAIGSWRLALVNQPDLTTAHAHQLELLLELARLYGKMDDWQTVREAADTFLDSGAAREPPRAAFANNAKGLALLRLVRRDQQNAERGEAALREAAELAPEVASYGIDLADYLAQKGDADDAERLFEQLVERHADRGPDAAKVRLAYAKHLARRERTDLARQYFMESMSRGEGDPTAWGEARLGYGIFLSTMWARAARTDPESPATVAIFDEAKTALKGCIDADADLFDPYLHLALLYKSAARFTDVVETCEARLIRGFSRRGVEATRNRVNMFSLMIYASEACVAEAMVAHKGGDQKRREKNLVRAEQYVTDARGEFPAHPRVMSQSARVKLARGQDRLALEDLRAAEEAYRSYDTIDWETKLLLARVHMKLSEPGAARVVLEEAIDEARRRGSLDVTLWSLYAQVLFQLNDFDRALALADQVLMAEPNHTDALRLKAAVLERLGRPEDARRVYERATGDSVIGAMLTARERALSGDVAGGIAVLREALEDNPADPRLVGAVVGELVNLDRSKEAAEIVRAALAARPGDIRLESLALLTREDLPPEQREQAALSIIENIDDGYQRTLELVNFYRRKSDHAKTLSLIDEALGHLREKDTPVAQNATIAQHRALLAAKLSVAFVLGDSTAMDAARDEGAAFKVDGANGKSILGLYHMQHKEYDLATRAFREAIKLQPTDSRSLLRLGQCLRLTSRTDEARTAFREAVSVNPNEGEAHWGLAVLAKARHDDQTYESELDECKRLIPRHKGVRAALIARREQADPRAAIARRELQLEDQPDDIENIRRLAVLCESVGDRAGADRHYLRLFELRPDDKDLAVVIGRYFRGTGRPDKSLEIATQYAESRSTPREKANARILIAAHHIAVGNPDEVERTLLAAEDLAETFEVSQSLAEYYLRGRGEPKKALPWFDKSVELGRAQESPQLPRTLAMRINCLLHRGLSDLDTARRYVDELRADFPEFDPGILLDSEVHARSGRIKSAIEALNEYIARNPNDTSALYQRALHSRAQGRPASAIEDLEAVKRIDARARGLEPRLLLARLHREAGRKDEWIRELETLLRDAPDAAVAIDHLARAYLIENRLADAEHVVTARINRLADEQRARWFFLRGQIALESKDEAKALRDFERGAEVDGYSAEGITAVLGAYLRLGRAAEGIDYYRRHTIEGDPPAGLISRYAALLARANREGESVDAFRRAMGLAASDGDTAVRAVTGDLRTAFPTDEALSSALARFEQDPPAGGIGRANDRILVRLLRLTHRYDKAATLLERLIAGGADVGERADLLEELGEVHQIGGNPTAARRAYEEALKYDGDNWVTLNNLAYLLSDAQGEYALARPYAERAAALVSSPDTLDTLGWIYVGLGEHVRAIAELSRAIRIDPSKTLTYYHLGEAYRRDGQFGEAIEIVESGLALAGNTDDDALAGRFETSRSRARSRDRAP